MKLFHLGDLHLGKRVNGFSMLEDQKYILDKILELVEQQKPDAVMIAGDVYDKTIPSAEAVELLDYFLTELVRKNIIVFMISGNHDSAERLHFGSQMFIKNQVYIAGTFRGKLQKVTVADEYGNLNFYLLPFIKPAMVAPYFKDREVETYEDAVQAILQSEDIDETERNILIGHQFVTKGGVAEESDSEIKAVGGVEQIDYSLFRAFDYVALGHLHSPQKVGRETVRYAGSPLKYSFSEARQKKCVTMLNMNEKEDISVVKHSLIPLRDMREVKGPIQALVEAAMADLAEKDDYIHATLTDEEELFDAVGQLRTVYPNLMTIDFENSKSKKSNISQSAAENPQEWSPLQLFCDFYEKQNNISMSDVQFKIVESLFEEIGGGVE